MGDDFGDCSTDGTCEGESGPGGMPKVPIPGVKFASTTLMEESESAVQQFAIVVGVCLLCIALFFAMIVITKSLDCVSRRCANTQRRDPFEDPEKAAAIVGSFKRYK